MRLKAHIPAILIFLSLAASGQWQEVQLDDGDMAFDLAEALSFQKYPTYPQYVEMLEYFASSYPEICRLDTFGTTPQGRLLLAVKISDNPEADEAEASFFYTSSMHGNELAGYPMMLRLIGHLLLSYGTDSEITRLVDDLAIWINPLANPDGTYYPDNDLSVAGSVRTTANGTDINREFPDMLAGEAVNDTAGRAMETKAMMAFLQEHRFAMSANIHSGAEVVNYPWDHTYSLHPDDGWFRFVSREYADDAREVDPDYMALFTDGITNGAQWYKINGGRQDYVCWYLGGREVTLELSKDYRLDSELLDEYWQKNERSLLNYMAQCTYGIRGSVSDADSEEPLVARVEILAYDSLWSVVHSSSASGDFYRLLEEGSYDVLVSAPGYLNDTIRGVQVYNYQATQLDVALEALPSSLEEEAAPAFSIWPNPAGEKLFIQAANSNPGSLEIMIYSTEGILLQRETLYSTGAPLEIEIGQLPGGLYLVKINLGGYVSVSMLFKE